MGVTLKLCAGKADDGNDGAGINDAQQAAENLGIPHTVLDFTEAFREKVILLFIEAYEQGLTPNPCIDCNRYVKAMLFERAKQLGIDYVVTGHYAQIEYDGRCKLKKALDASKDQSYFLYALTQEQLKMSLFPLGGLRKPEVRKIAALEGFPVAEKPDSQDICFVPDGNYAGFIESYTGECGVPGDFLDTSGNALGRHKGLIRYTVGQRKGLGIALGQPMYVHSKCTKSNTVTLCTDKELFSEAFYANAFNWIYEKPGGPIDIAAKIRYSQSAFPATAEPQNDGTVRICFAEPRRAVAKGQAVVLYDGDYVVGGGTII
jgi:tRNA-specific 2-thiouridylase